MITRHTCKGARNIQGNLLRPYLRWAGGKSTKVGQFRKFLPSSFARYCEPFLGSGAMFFALHPPEAVIGDLNPHLVNSLLAIKFAVRDLCTALQVHASDDTEEQFLATRDEFNRFDKATYTTPFSASDRAVQQAARFIYLNARAYNGLYRENRNGEFNVGCNLKAHTHHPRKVFHGGILHAISTYLNQNRIVIYAGSYEQSLQYVTGPMFFFLDPPYYSEGGVSFTSYNAESWGMDDLLKVRAFAGRLNDLGHQFCLCNADHPVVRDTFNEFHLHAHAVPRYINCDPSGRGPVPELVVTNYRLTRYKTLLTYMEAQPHSN